MARTIWRPMLSAMLFCVQSLSVFFSCFTILSMSQSVAQPKAVSPDDLSRIRQLSEFSNDWSETDAFDLEHYVTLQVTIESLQVPGHAGMYISGSR